MVTVMDFIHGLKSYNHLIQHKNSAKGKYCSVAFISVVTP